MATASAMMNSGQSSRNRASSQTQEGFVRRFVSPSVVGPRPQAIVLAARPASVRARRAPRVQSVSSPKTITWLDAGIVGSRFLAFAYEPSTVELHSYWTPWWLPITVVWGLSSSGVLGGKPAIFPAIV